MYVEGSLAGALDIPKEFVFSGGRRELSYKARCGNHHVIHVLLCVCCVFSLHLDTRTVQ